MAFTGVDALAERTAKVARELRESADALRVRGHAALESVPEQPVVKSAQARLAAAKDVLVSVKDTITANTSAVSDSLSSSVMSARQRASDAVADASKHVQDTVTTMQQRVLRLADAGAAAAARRAGALDARLKVQERCFAAAKALKVQERAASAAELATRLDTRLHLTDKVTATLARAEQVDASVTGGRGKRVVGYSQGAGEAVDFFFACQCFVGCRFTKFSLLQASQHKPWTSSRHCTHSLKTPALAAKTNRRM